MAGDSCGLHGSNKKENRSGLHGQGSEEEAVAACTGREQKRRMKQAPESNQSGGKKDKKI